MLAIEGEDELTEGRGGHTRRGEERRKRGRGEEEKEEGKGYRTGEVCLQTRY